MSKIQDAQSTCNGLHHLIRRLHGAAVDLDKGGESAYEILALLASTDVCINNLSAQLRTLDQAPAESSTVTSIEPVKNTIEKYTESKISENAPGKLQAVAGG